MVSEPEPASGSTESSATSSERADSSARNTLSQGVDRRRIVPWAATNSSGESGRMAEVDSTGARDSASCLTLVSTSACTPTYARPTSAAKAIAMASSAQLALLGPAGSRRWSSWRRMAFIRTPWRRLARRPPGPTVARSDSTRPSPRAARLRSPKPGSRGRARCGEAGRARAAPAHALPDALADQGEQYPPGLLEHEPERRAGHCRGHPVERGGQVGLDGHQTGAAAVECGDYPLDQSPVYGARDPRKR